MDVRLPDGTIIRGVPDDMTRAQLTEKLRANGYSLDEPATPKEPTPGDKLVSGAKAVAGGARDLAAGAVRGAGSIGATLLAPVDVASDFLQGKGLTLESNRQRRADMDAALADLTGADTDSLAYGGGKLATEIAGTLGVGGGAANVLARVLPGSVQAAPTAAAFLNALRSGGMTTGTRPIGMAAKAGDLAIRTAGGAAAGGLTAGAINPEDAPIGVAVGGAIPGAVKALGTAGHAVGSAMSGRLARNSAVNKLADVLGDDIGRTVADIQTYYPKGAENIPVSAAGITGNAKLAAVEQGSRLRATPVWHGFDQRQGQAVFDNMMDATREATELGARKGARADNWKAAWDAASQAQKPRVWLSRMNQFFDDVDRAMLTPESSNPAVKGVLDAIKGEMDRLGPNFGPGSLQQLRANLSGKANSMSPDVFKSAPRDNPAIISIMKEMDDILNHTTGGKWQKVIEGYAKDSEKVHAAAAAGKVRGAFIDDATGRLQGPALNADTPLVTQAGLNRAMNAARLPDKSLALSADANAKLEATIDALRRQGVVQQVKRTATAGGGSNTAFDLASSGAQAAGAPNMLMQLAGAVRQLGRGKVDNELALLLSSPDDLALALEALRAPRGANPIGGLAYRAAPALTADR